MSPLVAPPVSAVAAAALRCGARVATAESCTGGLLAARLTAVAGASRWFLGGAVAYDNGLKRRLLAVADDDLERFGAVSEAVAAGMCEGLLPMGATHGVAVTGIAGPSGGTAGRPVGTVCFGVCTAAGTRTMTECFEGSRHAIRRGAVAYALALLVASLKSDGGSV